LGWRWRPDSPWGGPTWSMSRTRKIRRTCCTTSCSRWGRWGLAGAAGGARVGSHVVRDGGDACADRPDAAFGRAALHRAEYGHPAWCLRGVAHRLRSTVPAREFGGIEVRPRPTTNRPAGSSRARFGSVVSEQLVGEESPIQCAGINRHEAENAKFLRVRSSGPLGPEFCVG